MRALASSLLAALLALFALSRSTGQGGAEDHPAVKAARAREKAIKTVAIQFKMTEVLAKGAVSAGQPGPLKPAKVVPEKETTLESTNRLVFDGRKVRYEHNHPTWLLPNGKLVKPDFVGAFDGTQAKSLHPRGLDGTRHPQGFLLMDGRLEFVRALDLIPLNSTFRGNNPNFSGYTAGQLKPTNRTVLIDGAMCDEIVPRRVGQAAPSGTAMYFDPTKDYVLRRIRMERNGRTSIQLDATYRRDKQHGWLPISWVRTDYGSDGALIRTARFTVLDLKINAPQAPEQFEIRFEPGTSVYDQRNNKWYRVQPNGELREDAAGGM
jgi:hypothetical protein